MCLLHVPADTPGVHLHHRVPHMLSPEELKLMHPRKRLVPVVPPSPRELTLGPARATGPPAGSRARGGGPRDPLPRAGSKAEDKSAPVAGTYVWSDLVRVDVVGCAPSTRLAFYGPASMRVSAMPLVKAGAD
jgi:nitric-oxide synthase